MLSDLLASGESVYTNPKSSAIKETGAEQLQTLLLNSDTHTELLSFVTGRTR